MLRSRVWLARVAVGVLVTVAPLAVAQTSGATGEPPDAPAGSANTFQLNALHDGYSADQLSLPLGKLWSVDLGAQVGYPLIVNGRVFCHDVDPRRFGTARSCGRSRRRRIRRLGTHRAGRNV